MSQSDIRQSLWEAYSQKKSFEVREKLIIEYAPLVKIVAGRVKIYLGSHVDFDDLVSYGIFGLIDAIDKFDYFKGYKFETYASLRIRGEIIDNIRRLDWVPRSLRKKYKDLESFNEDFEKKYSRLPTDDEICKALDIPKSNLMEIYKNYSTMNLVSLDDCLEQNGEMPLSSLVSSDSYQPENEFLVSELKQNLTDAINSLTDRQREVMNLYYYEELTLKEISVIMSVSESRVSQIHSNCIRTLRAKLGKYKSFIV